MPEPPPLRAGGQVKVTGPMAQDHAARALARCRGLPFLVLLFFAGCGEDEKTTAQQAPGAGAPPTVAVAVSEPVKRRLTEWDEYTGRQGVGFEWTDLCYQQTSAGNTAIYTFPLRVPLVFLVLAALYESWRLPIAIILIVPMRLLSAIGGIALLGMDDNILTRIGFVALVGLASKNAILIVEVAKQHEEANARGPVGPWWKRVGCGCGRS